MCRFVILRDDGGHRVDRFESPKIVTNEHIKKIAEVLGLPPLSDSDARARSVLILRGERSLKAARGG
jgi:hypothetical protein